MPSRLLFLFAETPVHAGGSESFEVVDLPIQREAATTLPVIWGQSLKGALRETARDAGWDGADIKAVFGSPPPGEADSDGEADPGNGNGTLVKGEVAIGDAQLLLFPAATLSNTFAWVTSGLLLSRLLRKLSLLDQALGRAWPASSPAYAVAAGPTWSGTQVIGPYVQQTTTSTDVPRIAAALAGLVCPDAGADPDRDVFAYTRSKLATDLLLASDEVLTGLARSGTDVVARVQLKPGAKTVEHGPFYSEHLPAETVLVAVLNGPEPRLAKLAGLLHRRPMRLGGDETIGKGLLWCTVHDAESLRGVVESPASDGSASAKPAPAPTPAPTPAPAGSAPNPGMLARKAHR
ncbi:MAG: type III-B CRISPR module RAMP protein Cmr4 [Sciscionella sp.]